MTSMIYVDPDYGPSAAEILDAVRQSEGSPGAVRQLPRSRREARARLRPHDPRIARDIRPGKRATNGLPGEAPGMSRAAAAGRRPAPLENRLGALARRQPGRCASGLRPACRCRAAAEPGGVRARGPRRGLAGGAILAAARRGGANPRRLGARRTSTRRARRAQTTPRNVRSWRACSKRCAGPTTSVLPTRKPRCAASWSRRRRSAHEALEHQCRLALARSLCWQDRPCEAGEILGTIETSPAPSTRVRGADAPIAHPA